MNGELIAILTTICWSIGIFPFTEASKRIGAAAVNQYRLLMAWLMISMILIFFYSIDPLHLFNKPSSRHYLFLGLSGIIGFTIGDYCSFRSFALLGPKLGSLYTTFAPGAALVAGFMVLNETINIPGIIGVMVTIAGVIWLTLSKKDKIAAEKAGFKRDRKGILLGIIGALCQGTGLVLSKLGMDAETDKLETMHAVWIRLLFAFTMAFIVSVFTRNLLRNSKPVFTNQNNAIPFMLLGTLFGPIAGVTLSLLAIPPVQSARRVRGELEGQKPLRRPARPAAPGT